MKTSNENDEGLKVAICSLSFPFCHGTVFSDVLFCHFFLCLTTWQGNGGIVVYRGVVIKCMLSYVNQ